MNAWKQYPFERMVKPNIFTSMNLITLNIEQINQLCLKHKVRKLYVFGSVLKDSFTNESDIDLVVDFEKIDLQEYADNYFDLKDQLEYVFKRPVDLLEEKGIRNPFLRQQIDFEKQLIYG